MGRIDTDQILREIKANGALLDGCAGPHTFVPHERYGSDGKGMVRKYRCQLCGGTVDVIAKLWYERGLKHGQNAIPTNQSDRGSDAKPSGLPDPPPGNPLP